MKIFDHAIKIAINDVLNIFKLSTLEKAIMSHAKNYDKKTKLFAAALLQQTHPFFFKDTMSFQFQICLWCKSKFFLCFFFVFLYFFLNVFFMKKRNSLRESEVQT